MMEFFQKLGKSLMLPVCVLPVCGILMGVGYILCPESMQGGTVEGFREILGYLLVKAGGAIIDNMSILFVIGVSVGMACDGHGTAALAGIASYLVITKLLSPSVMSVLFTGMTETDLRYLAFSKIENPFIGILSGCIGAGCYNRFRSVVLPDALAFFSGRRFVSIVTVLLSFLLAALLALIWPTCYSGMVYFGQWIASLGAAGCGLYVFFNRLLIPTGLHHALNNVFWFDTIGIGDLTKFWAGKTSEEVGWSLGMYMSGFFPCMIGGVPGAALAMYHCARNKKAAAGALFSTAFCAFLCGVTEPFEFSFMFLSFPLYVVYSALYGLFAVLTYLSGFRAGFAFSAGVTDLVCSASLPAAQKTWMIIPLSLLAFVVFYLTFRFIITKFKIATIGRAETASAESAEIPAEQAAGLSQSAGDRFARMAEKILEAVGGAENVVSSDCCATRLRLELKDSSRVNAEAAKAAGAAAVVCPGKTSCQVVIGTTVQQVLEAFDKARTETGAGGRAGVTTSENPDAGTATVTGAGMQPGGTSSEAVLEKVSHGDPVWIPLMPEDGAFRAGAQGGTSPNAPAVNDSPESVTLLDEGGVPAYRFTVKDPSGIHARPAGQMAAIAKKYGCRVVCEAHGKTASASSPVQLMDLGVLTGDEVLIRAEENTEAAKACVRELAVFVREHL